MTPDQIKAALETCFAGGVLSAPDTLFGSGTLKAVFDRSLPDGVLTITGTMTEANGGVTVSGSGHGPFAGMDVTAVFTPQGDDVLLVATGTDSGGWSIASAFPQLADSILAGLEVSGGATLVLRTISDDQHPAGLGFKGSVGVGGPLEQALMFIGAATSLDFAGPITFTLGAPDFALIAPVASPFSLGPLENLGISIALNSASAPPPPTGGAGGALGSISANTAIALTVNGQTAKLPASMLFSGGALLDLRVAAPSGSGVTIADLAGFALGGDLTALIPPKALYDVAGAISLDSIDFTIAPLKPSLVGVTFDLSVTRPWTIGSKFTVTGVGMSLYVSGSGAASGSISGSLQIGENGSVCTLDASASLPDGTFQAKLDPAGNKPNISDLVTFVAGDFSLPAIQVSDLSLALTPTDGNYSLAAGFSSDWSLNVGDFALAVTGAAINLDYAGGQASGGVAGTLVLDEANKFDLSYKIPGGFKLVAQVPSLSLKTLIGALCRDVGAPPSGFDFTFIDATILITEDNGQFSLELGAQLESYGSAAVVVEHSAQWSFAFGVLLDTPKLAALPGLGLLSLIDDAFGLEEIVVVFGTLAQQTFSFPALSDFGNSTIKAPKVSSPAWDGTLVQGLNIYAMLDPAGSEALGWLCKLVGFQGKIAASLEVPENPADGTTFAATLSGKVNSNMALSGGFVAKLVGGTLELGLTGTIPTSIAGHDVIFKVEVDFQTNGIFVSGSTTDTIDFDVVQLGGLAIELGVDAEGIPSIGFAATIQAGTFDSSIAIFLDSANPAQSLFAGSISDVTLDSVMGPIIGVTSLPSEIDSILKQISLKGTASFTLPAALAQSLDDRDTAAVIAAFAAAGAPLNSDVRAVSILGASAQGSWAVTDLSTLTHYHLSKGADGAIAAEKEAQVKFVPQTTQLASLPPVTGPAYAMSGALSVFGLTGTVDIDIEPSTGLSIECALSPLHLLNDKLLVITDSAGDGQGPFLSVCTYQKDGKQPHAIASGKVELLGLVGESVSIDISAAGATFTLSSDAPVYSYSIDVALSSSTGFIAHGRAQVGFDQSIDLGALGTLPLQATVGGTIDASLNGTLASAGFSGSFNFGGAGFSVGPVSLDVTSASLENLATGITDAVAEAVRTYLLGNLDPSRWLAWVKRGVIPGMLGAPDKVGAALGSAFHQTADQIAALSKNVLGYSADVAAAALQGANFAAGAASTALAGAGYAADEVAKAVNAVFHVHADTGVHIDTPGGPHSDTAPHVDTPAGPHSDSAIPPHGDTSTHIDTPGVHADKHTFLGHVDQSVPPHGDTSAHVDTPHGPHADTPVPPHGDTSGPHVDTPVPPHGDTSQHIDLQP